MNFIVLGLSHKTASIDLREKFFLNPLQQDLLLSELKSDPAVVEAFVLSTCNRTEVYLHTIPIDRSYLQPKDLSFPNALVPTLASLGRNPDRIVGIGNPDKAMSGPPTTTNGSPRHEGKTFGGDSSEINANHLKSVLKLITNIKKIEFSPEITKHFYVYEKQGALRHLLRVTCGLDSLVVGEKQIIGQVKTAVERARAKGMFGRYFNILFNIAIRTAKKAQTETTIGYGGSSISWAAMTMAEEVLETLEGKSILIIGAGKMGELALQQIRNKGVKNIYVMNRTGQSAQALAKICQATAVSFMDIKETLSEVDVCICAAGAPHYILDRTIIEKVMNLRHQRKLILIDISMPRNIDPQIADIPHAFLSCIDDLNQVVTETMIKRQAAVSSVEKIIERQLVIFSEKLSKLKADSSSVDIHA